MSRDQPDDRVVNLLKSVNSGFRSFNKALIITLYGMMITCGIALIVLCLAFVGQMTLRYPLSVATVAAAVASFWVIGGILTGELEVL